jgi:Zn-dependent protease
MADSPTPAPRPDFEAAFPVYVEVRPRPRYAIHFALLVATLLTMLVVGARFQYYYQQSLPFAPSGNDPLPSFFPRQWIFAHPANLLMGFPFALALMAILFAHEMGHYIACRRYGVDATLPYFIPAPTLIGTLGAFIRIRSEFRSRRALFDIGVAGPIAGFLVALPISIVGLALSHPLRDMPPSDIELGFPLAFHGIHRLLVAAGMQPPGPMNHLVLHPLAIAGWFGMFATALNLLPGGQLDGGHLVFSFSEKAHKIVSWITLLTLLPMAWYGWPGWLIWAVVLSVSGLKHPTVYSWDEMDAKRWLLLGVAAIMLVICIAPMALIDVKDQFRSDVTEVVRNSWHWVRALLHR